MGTWQRPVTASRFGPIAKCFHRHLRSKDLNELWRRTGEPHFASRQIPHERLEPDPGWISKITIDDWGTPPQRRFGNRGDHMELLSGGRAVAENLQLDRQLRIADE